MKLFHVSNIRAATNANHTDTTKALTDLGIMPVQSFDTFKRSYRLYDQGALDAVVQHFEKQRAAKKAAKASKVAPSAPVAAAPIAAPQTDMAELHAKLDEILRHMKRLADELTTVEAQA